jgi:hypothetical protein
MPNQRPLTQLRDRRARAGFPTTKYQIAVPHHSSFGIPSTFVIPGRGFCRALLRSSTDKPEHILHIVEARRLLDHPARGVECAVGEGFPTARLMN